MGNDTWLRKLARALFGPIAAGLPSEKALALLSGGIGLAAAVCFATGDPFIREIGAGVFILWMLFERSGPVPSRNDTNFAALRSGAMVQVMVFVGLGFGLRYSALGAEAIGMGVVSGFAVSALLLLARRIERADDGRLPTMNGLDTSDLLLIFPAFIWLGKAEAMLAVTSYAAPAMTLGLFVAFLIRQRLKKKR